MRWIITIVIGALLVTGGYLAVRGWTGEKPGPSRGGFSLADRPELALGRTEEYDYDPPVPGSYDLPVIQSAGDGSVIGAGGERRRLHDLLQGKITLLSFVYTRCADATACPYATGVLAQVHEIARGEPQMADAVQLITFSFDPAHDTPEMMAQYRQRLGEPPDRPPWLFLTTSDRTVLQPILESYGQRVDLKADPEDPLGPFNHMLRVYLIDPDRKVRNIYSTGMLDPRMVITDIRTLLLDGPA